MMFEYVAEQRLIAGHVATTTYQMDAVASVSDFSGTVFVNAHESLSGAREVVKQSREDDEWTVNVVRILKASLPQWEEFFYSVVDGTTFDLDLYGTIAVPDDVKTVVMLSTNISPIRKGTSDYFNLSFRVRVDV